MSRISPKIAIGLIIVLVGYSLLLQDGREAEGSEVFDTPPVMVPEEPGAEKKGVFEYLSGVIKEIKSILLGIKDGFKLLSRLLSLMGIKVLIMLLLTLILTIGLKLLNLASGKISFFISLTAIGTLWYFVNRIIRPDHSGDLRTILLTALWVIIPLIVFALIGWVLDKSGYLLKREFWLSSLGKRFQREKPLARIQSIRAARRSLYNFENYSEQFSALAHRVLAGNNEEDKKEIELEMEKLRRKMVDILSSGEEKS
ncbi:MAG: hypothetical protein JSU92_12790 [Deltaproteobacteria bacterium]|nr:MAG: hypothetical protein JSU92_12790 [Deltaproteobacteria bacterium]